jgi:hypothetical protein
MVFLVFHEFVIFYDFIFHLFLVCVNIAFEDLVNTNNQWMNLLSIKKNLNKNEKKKDKGPKAPT